MTPIVRGLYLAGRVDVDPATRNLTLVNCFRALRLPALPGAARPFCLVAYLANGFGDTRLEARVSRLDTFDVVYQMSGELRFPDRLAEVRVVLRVDHCRFPVAGGYEVGLYVNGDHLTATPFRVLPRIEVN